MRVCACVCVCVCVCVCASVCTFQCLALVAATYASHLEITKDRWGILRPGAQSRYSDAVTQVCIPPLSHGSCKPIDEFILLDDKAGVFTANGANGFVTTCWVMGSMLPILGRGITGTYTSVGGWVDVPKITVNTFMYMYVHDANIISLPQHSSVTYILAFQCIDIASIVQHKLY